jgi:hypothetical protein
MLLLPQLSVNACMRVLNYPSHDTNGAAACYTSPRLAIAAACALYSVKCLVLALFEPFALA